MRTVRRAGAVILLGNPAGDLALPAQLWSQLMRREVRLYGTWNSDYCAMGPDDDWHATLAAMANKTLDVRPLITHRVPFADTIQQFPRLLEPASGVIKAVIEIPA